ncbi:MAG: hypothetical protein AAF581_11020 [Planctomycetota bacterium]
MTSNTSCPRLRQAKARALTLMLSLRLRDKCSASQLDGMRGLKQVEQDIRELLEGRQ